MGKNYRSMYIASNVACWLKADVHRLDTHAYWSAHLCERREHKRDVACTSLFQDYLCDAEVFLDWIKRGVVAEARQFPKDRGTDFFAEEAWAEVEETLEACKPFLVIPLSDEAVEYSVRYREPDTKLWYEVVVDTFTDEAVTFSLNLWGYKYVLEGLLLPKDPFYILTDRLEARVRFLNTWTSLDEARRELMPVLRASGSLSSIKADLKHAISAPGTLIGPGLDTACRAIFPLLERLLRDVANRRGWPVHRKNFDGLITLFETNRALSDDTIQVLRLVAKPFRDVVLHGRRLAPPLPKSSLLQLSMHLCASHMISIQPRRCRMLKNLFSVKQVN